MFFSETKKPTPKSDRLFHLLNWNTYDTPEAIQCHSKIPPTHTGNGTGWLVIKSRLPALLGPPFHARSSHSWRAHGKQSFTICNHNTNWFWHESNQCATITILTYISNSLKNHVGLKRISTEYKFPMPTSIVLLFSS